MRSKQKKKEKNQCILKNYHARTFTLRGGEMGYKATMAPAKWPLESPVIVWLVYDTPVINNIKSFYNTAILICKKNLWNLENKIWSPNLD